MRLGHTHPNTRMHAHAVMCPSPARDLAPECWVGQRPLGWLLILQSGLIGRDANVRNGAGDVCRDTQPSTHTQTHASMFTYTLVYK